MRTRAKAVAITWRLTTLDDPILTETPAPPAAPAPAPDSRLDQMQSQMTELRKLVETVGGQLLQNQQAQSQPRKSSDEVLTEFASDPQGVMKNIAREAVQEGLASSLGPAGAAVFDTVHRQLMAGHQAEIDYRFGEGAYDEHFKPALEQDFAQLRKINPQALADQATMDALVKRQYGEHFDALRDRRERLEKTAAARGMSHLIPTGGVPRLRIAGDPREELSADHELFIKETDRSTGQRTDPKAWAKLHHTGTQVGPDRHRTSLQDFADVTGMTPEKRAKYGLS